MSDQEKKNKEGGKRVLSVCIVLIVVLLGVVIFLLLNKEEKEEKKRNVIVNKNNVEEALDQLENSGSPNSYEVTMNSTWNFANGNSPSENAYVENSESNTNSVYFDVIRTDTDETIFESPILPVGSYLDNITLDSKLSAGTYDCLVTYHLLDEKEQSISTVKLTLTINVEQ